MTDFDYKAIEALEVKDLASIEAITGPLTHNVELKTEDEHGNLVTVIRTSTPEGQEQVQYVRRTKAGDGLNPVAFNVDIDSEEASELVPA